MNGYLPVSHREIESWERKTGRSLDVLELEAIKQIDHVLRHPEPVAEQSETKREDAIERTPKPWPTRKGAKVDG